MILMRLCVKNQWKKLALMNDLWYNERDSRNDEKEEYIIDVIREKTVGASLLQILSKAALELHVLPALTV